MNPQQFAQKIARIEHQHAPSTSEARRVLVKLVRRVGAAYVIRYGKITGYRLPGGGIVCRKRRYHSHECATREMRHIVSASRRSHVPVRVYSCPTCKGYHLTSNA